MSRKEILSCVTNAFGHNGNTNVLVCRFPGLLHTIMFNRALGPVRPYDVDSELFEISYVRAISNGLSWLIATHAVLFVFLNFSV